MYFDIKIGGYTQIGKDAEEIYLKNKEKNEK